MKQKKKSGLNHSSEIELLCEVKFSAWSIKFFIFKLNVNMIINVQIHKYHKYLQSNSNKSVKCLAYTKLIMINK